MKKLITLILFLTGIVSVDLLQAQNTDFQLANRMIQQQNYEDALPILEQLYEENPEANIFFDRLIDVLVHLKEYDTAAEKIDDRINQGHRANQLLIRKGEILHTKGDRETALKIWEEVIGQNERNMQFYYQIGNTMMNRREYTRAADLYLKAREVFDDRTMFINEVASAQMQSGNFAEAMNEFFRLVQNNPNQMNYVQQQLLRMQDNELYEIAALEIEDYILEMNTDHTAYNQMHQLYTWLLTETKQFRRAFIAARQYESRTDVLNYSLYSLASQLLSNNEFELAAESYNYYTESSNLSVRHQARDREARVYQLWADYLNDYNLDELQRREELYEKSYQLSAELVDQAPSYEQRDRLIVRLAELSLDVLFDMEKAVYWVEKLEQELRDNTSPNLYYLQGRLHLFNNSYSNARQAFTRANRNSEDSGLSEKARYFLSLTDFFSGDFEFALIQLRSLERRNVSYYANNALKLRMWIQEGKRADTTGADLRNFASVLEKLYSGDTNSAIEFMLENLDFNYNPLTDNALVEISNYSNIRHIPIVYTMIKKYNSGNRNSPLRERLLWEEAAMARNIINAGGADQLMELSNPENESILNGFRDEFEIHNQWPATMDYVEELFERLILEFPQGFYAPHAREELRQLTRLSS